MNINAIIIKIMITASHHNLSIALAITPRQPSDFDKRISITIGITTTNNHTHINQFASFFISEDTSYHSLHVTLILQTNQFQVKTEKKQREAHLYYLWLQ